MPILGYLDANSGSIIVAAVLAGFAGLAVFLRAMWHRIRHPFGGDKSEDTADLDATDDDEAVDGDDEAVDDIVNTSADQA